MIVEFLEYQFLIGNTTKTIKYYSENLALFSRFLALHDLDIADVQCYDNYAKMLLKRRNIKRVTVRTYLRAVRVFLRWCTDKKYIDYGYSVNLPKSHNELILPLSDEEIKTVYEAFIDKDILTLRNKCIFSMLLDCGLRMSEVVNLKCTDVIFNQNMLVVNGKGNKQRYVPFGQKLKEMLLHYDNSVLRDCDMFFVCKNHSAITQNTIKMVFQRLKKSTGIKRLHAHLLRHTFATRYLLNGGSLPALRLLLGHADINITQVYLHLAEYYNIVHRQSISTLDMFDVN